MDRSPVDSYYSWTVAVASSVIFLLASCPVRLGSQLFVTMLHQYDATREAASFPFALISLMRSVSGPFAGFFSVLLGLQGVTLCGCLFCTIGVGACFFAESIEAYDICLGIITGIGFGWSTALIPEILNEYFDKHRTKAYGIFMAGSGLGAFIGPPLLEAIIEKYGMSGTCLIMCGIIFNSVPAALLLKKPKILKENKAKTDVTTIDNEITNYGKELLVMDKLKSEKISNYHTNDFSLEKEQKRVELSSFEESESKIDKKESSKYSLTTFNCIHELPKRSPVLLNAQNLTEQFTQSSFKQNTRRCIEPIVQKTSKSCLNSIDVIWQPIFLCLTFMNSWNAYVNYVFWTITIDIVRDKGIKSHLEIYFLMSMNLFDLLGRFFLGLLADSGFISITNLCACYFLIMCLSCFMITWTSSFSLLMFILCFLGLVFGANTALLPVAVTEFIVKEKRTIAMASRLIMYVPMSFTISPLIGYFRGTLGSYNGYLYTMASLCLMCSIGVFMLPRFVNVRSRKK